MVCCLVLGMGPPPRSQPAGSTPPALESAPEPTVTCTPLGLYGDITMRPVVGSLSDTGGDLTFVGTTNGLYVVASDGKLSHFLYSPFGIRHLALIEDVTGDGIREVVVALNDTQVPGRRCYDGATREKLWQFAPMARIWDRLWVDRQSIITNLAVTGEGDSQSLLLTSGRCVLSVDAATGAEQWRSTAPSAPWRVVTLADLNGNGSDEVLVGCSGGHLIWLEAVTGRKQWQTTLPEHEGASQRTISHLVSDIAVLDDGAGLLAAASGDGSVQLYDLLARRLAWDTLAFNDAVYDPSVASSLLMSPAGDITGDGLGELILCQCPDLSIYSGYMATGRRALCDSTGQVVWQTEASDDGSLVWPGMASETSLFAGQPVFLNMVRGMEGPARMDLVDIRDGQSVLHTVPLDALGSLSIVVNQPQGGGFLAFSSSADLAAMTAEGGLLWYYPRITGIQAVRGDFVGSGTEDVLLEWGSAAGSYSESSVRLLQVMDGATGAVAWSYEVPHAEWVGGGGLRSLQVAADLVGDDNVPDIAGCRGERVFVFSGRDGTVSSLDAGQPVSSLETVHTGAGGTAFALNISDSATGASGNAAGLLIMDQAGNLLWSTETAAWLGEEGGSFMALDDINSDNATDLAVAGRSRIVVLESTDNASAYELGQTVLAESGFSIRLPEMVGDSDGDGLGELAYLQETSDWFGPSDGRHLLCVQSLEDGRPLFRCDLQGGILGYDVACGDFNADGAPDSVVKVQSLEWDRDPPACYESLRIVSGKDGALIWEKATQVGGYGWSGGDEGVDFQALTATNAGDINGDGIDDLASLTEETEWREYGGTLRQQRLRVFDVLHNEEIMDIAVTPWLQDDGSGSDVAGQAPKALLLTDVDADGRGEMITAVSEPSLPRYDPDTPAIFEGTGSPRHIAVTDLESGRRLCAFAGLDPAGVSVLGSQVPGTLTVAACGGLCSLRLEADLQVTSPDDGASTGPTVAVSWESPSGGLSQVFVDGVRNEITHGSRSELYLSGGEHRIVVRSVDDWGRVSYGPADLDTPVIIGVGSSPWKPAWLVLGLFALLALVLALFYPRLHRARRARRLPRGGSNVH